MATEGAWGLRHKNIGRRFKHVLCAETPRFDIGLVSAGTAVSKAADGRTTGMIRRTLAGVDALILRGATTAANRNGAARQAAALRGLGNNHPAASWAAPTTRHWSSQEAEHKVCVCRSVTQGFPLESSTCSGLTQMRASYQKQLSISFFSLRLLWFAGERVVLLSLSTIGVAAVR